MSEKIDSLSDWKKRKKHQNSKMSNFNIYQILWVFFKKFLCHSIALSETKIMVQKVFRKKHYKKEFSIINGILYEETLV